MGITCSGPHPGHSCAPAVAHATHAGRILCEQNEERFCGPSSETSVEVNKIKNYPSRLPAETREAVPEKPRNPEVLTPKGPPKEPYALAGGLDTFLPAIHASLEPQSLSMSASSTEVAAAQCYSQPFVDSRLPHPEQSRNRPIVGSRPAEPSKNDAAELDGSSVLRSSPSFSSELDAVNNKAETEDLWPPRLRAHVTAYRNRLHAFLQRSECGVRCRATLAEGAKPRMSTYMCHLPTGTLRIIPIASTTDQMRSFRIAGICGVSVGGGGQATRSARPINSSSYYLHFDTVDGAFSLLLEEVGAAEAREDFLDCIAVLIATLRYRARQRGEPPPCDVSTGFPRSELLEAWEPGNANAARGLELLRSPGESLAAHHLRGYGGALLSAIGDAVVQELRGDEWLV